MSTDRNQAELSQAELNKKLLTAAMKGNLEVVEAALEAGADLNLASENGFTPLVWAAYRGDVAIVEMLLEKGADPNWVGKGDDSPLNWAAIQGHVAVVEKLLAAGADPNQTDKDGNTPLSRAVSRGRVSVVVELLAAGVSPNLANKDGTTPLSWAARNDDVDMAIYLLLAGARPDNKFSEVLNSKTDEKLGPLKRLVALLEKLTTPDDQVEVRYALIEHNKLDLIAFNKRVLELEKTYSKNETQVTRGALGLQNQIGIAAKRGSFFNKLSEFFPPEFTQLLHIKSFIAGNLYPKQLDNDVSLTETAKQYEDTQAPAEAASSYSSTPGHG